ncbi:MAG TPA: hypothetical protein VLN90_08100 [Thioalkalivibrio sp.]|nr:hypothetical protein [Thioalkalivibrio sp.]
MSQNIVSVVFTAEERAALLATVDQLQTQLLPKTIAMDAGQRRELMKMGVKSENFCRQAISALDKNRQVVPPSLGLDDAIADLAALDLLRPVLLDLEKLVERLRDTDTALGSDLMDAAVEGYALLKVTGDRQGLDGLVKDLGLRFARRGRRSDIPEPDATPEPVAATP